MNNRQNYIKCLFAVSTVLIYSITIAQNIRATVNRNRIFIGEQIQLKLSIERARAGSAWFTIPDSVNHIEVVSRSKIDTVAAGGFTNYYQTLNLTSFDSGRWQFPGLTIPGINRITVPITIDVLPVDVSKLKDYHEIRDIEEVQAQTDWTIIIIIAVLTLISIAMVVWLILKKKRAQALKPDTLPNNVSPLEWALAELEKLHKRRPDNPREIKKYYSELNDLSRRFFEMQLQQNAMKQTTDEWMMNLQPLEVDSEAKTSFFQFLRLADTVKFARYVPSSGENETSVTVVRNMLQKAAMLHSDLYSKYQPQSD